MQNEFELLVSDADLEKCVNDAADFRDMRLSVILRVQKVIQDAKEETSSSVGNQTY